jgi:hypothetical protein
MIKKVYDVLGYLIVIRVIALISKTFVEPILERKGYTEKEMERFVLAFELIEIAMLLAVLKK